MTTIPATGTVLQQVYANEVIAADRALHRESERLAIARERNEKPEVLEEARALVHSKQATLNIQIALLRTTGALDGTTSESSAVVRAYEIGANIVYTGTRPVTLTPDERADQEYDPRDRDEFGHGLGELNGDD